MAVLYFIEHCALNEKNYFFKGMSFYKCIILWKYTLLRLNVNNSTNIHLNFQMRALH